MPELRKRVRQLGRHEIDRLGGVESAASAPERGNRGVGGLELVSPCQVRQSRVKAFALPAGRCNGIANALQRLGIPYASNDCARPCRRKRRVRSQIGLVQKKYARPVLRAFEQPA